MPVSVLHMDLCNFYMHFIKMLTAASRFVKPLTLQHSSDSSRLTTLT